MNSLPRLFIEMSRGSRSARIVTTIYLYKFKEFTMKTIPYVSEEEQYDDED